MNHCPRCSRDYELPPPGGIFRCRINPPPTCGCFVHENFHSLVYDKLMEGKLSARDPLLQEREKTHGSFVITARAAQGLKDEMHEEPNWEKLNDSVREALDLIATKIARIISGGAHKEHFIDIAGYAKLGEEACDN